MPRRYSYCPHCAMPVVDQTIRNLTRQICPPCHAGFRQNPMVGGVMIMDCFRDTRTWRHMVFSRRP